MKKFFTSIVVMGSLAIMTAPSASAVVRYVSPSGTGDGSSWAKATGNLQAAINASVAGDEVWVAAGSYRPDSLINPKKITSETFFLKDGVSLYGGFAGNETSKEARQLKATGKPYDFVNETVLNADDEEPDVWRRKIADATSYRFVWETVDNQVPGTASNSTHVLYAADVIKTHTEINGFTLTGGNANVWKVKAAGGALYAQGNVSLKACRVVKNSAYFTGQSIEDSNTYGGAVFLNGAGSASISDCYFDSNYSHSSYGNGVGGAVYVKNATVQNCEFIDCVGEDAGGAIYGDKATISNCTFTRCYAGSGGAIFNSGGMVSGATVSDCSGLKGGGIFNTGTIKHAKIYNCYADAEDFGPDMGGQGGGIFNLEGNVMGSVVYNNYSFRGAGIYLCGGKIVNCTVQNNKLRNDADTANIGFFAQKQELKANVLNTIGNPNAAASNFVKPSTFTGVATNATDSLSLSTMNWSLAAGSEFIDAGTVATGFEEPTDIAGNARVAGESIDVGAYESQSTAPKASIVLTYAKAGEKVCLGVGGNKGYVFKVDWGDGVLKEYSTASYYTETLKGKVVKVYGDSVLIVKAKQQKLNAINIDNAKLLQQVHVGGNNIKTLNVKNNVNLTGIYAEDNRLTSIDVTANVALRVLDVHNNAIAGKVDCSAMPSLSKVDVSDNKVTDLLLPKHKTLYEIKCGNNLIKQLDVAGLNGLDRLSCAENQLTQLDLTGMDALNELYAYDNALTSINPEMCLNLKTLSLSGNKFSKIKLGANTTLQGVYLYDNQLKELDLTANTGVQYLNISNNQIAELNTSTLANLSRLLADNNKLTAVNLDNNTRLSQVKLAHNQLSQVDVSKAPYLSWLKVDHNNLTSLDLKSNKYLYWLECNSNKIASLDLKSNTVIQRIAAEHNQLTSLDLSVNPGVQGLSIQHNPMSDATIDAIIAQLQDVSGVKIDDNNRDWGRELKYSCSATGKVKRADAEAKGWKVTEFVASAINHVVASEVPVSTTYYNLSGQQLQGEIEASGFYIVKQLWSNGKVTATKVYINK